MALITPDAKDRYKQSCCDLCRKKDTLPRLHLHHKDRNPHNNHPDNLQTLCRKCHKSEHASLNRTQGKLPSGYGNQIGLRIPDALLQKVKVAAGKDKRSINNYLTLLIEKEFDKRNA